MASAAGNLCCLTQLMRSQGRLLVDAISAILLSKKDRLVRLVEERKACQSSLALVCLYSSSVCLHSSFHHSLDRLVTVMFLVLASLPALPVPTHYSDTDSHANSVIDLIFLDMSSAQISHRIEPNLRLPSDHAPLLVDLPISPENIHLHHKALKCDSEEENTFLSAVNMGLRALNFSSLDSTASLDLLAQAISQVFSHAWEANARNITVTS